MVTAGMALFALYVANDRKNQFNYLEVKERIELLKKLKERR